MWELIISFLISFNHVIFFSSKVSKYNNSITLSYIKYNVQTLSRKKFKFIKYLTSSHKNNFKFQIMPKTYCFTQSVLFTTLSPSFNSYKGISNSNKASHYYKSVKLTIWKRYKLWHQHRENKISIHVLWQLICPY